MKKLLISLISLGILAIIFWCFILRSYDYAFRFDAKTSPGTIFYAVREWSKDMDQEDNGIASRIITEKIFSELQQELHTKNGKDVLSWSIQGNNDSISTVRVGVKNNDNSFSNKIALLIHPKEAKNNIRKKIEVFKEGLKRHLQKFKIKIEGIAENPTSKCVCLKLESKMVDKANEMIASNALLMSYISEKKLEISGKPLVDVTYWNKNSENLKFDYCFPLKKDIESIDAPLKLKTITSKRSLKVTYYGNYRTSDRAWFAIKDYAQRNNFSMKETPIEYYLNNPFYENDELQWKTEIYFPLIN